MTKADGNGATIRVGLIQIRSGRTPAANLDAAAKLVAEAEAGGADYVQTPEMTNILEAKRDATLAAFRELARQHALWLHVGSLALKVSPDRAVNRGFLIAPDGASAARYDTPFGPATRDADAVRQALATLRDPNERAVQELWAEVAPNREGTWNTPAAQPWEAARRALGWSAK